MTPNHHLRTTHRIGYCVDQAIRHSVVCEVFLSSLDYDSASLHVATLRGLKREFQSLQNGSAKFMFSVTRLNSPHTSTAVIFQ